MDRSVGTGVLMLGVAWLIFWLTYAFPLFKTDPRWGHNFAIPLIFITVGLAYHFRKLSCQLVAAFASFLTVPTFLALWSWGTATLAAAALLIVTVVLYLIERFGRVELVNPRLRFKVWLKIHSLNFAYLGLAHMPMIFFLVRWLNPTPFLNYLPMEHEVSTTVFNLMLLILTIMGMAERFAKNIGRIQISKLGFTWAMLMLIVPLLDIFLLKF